MPQNGHTRGCCLNTVTYLVLFYLFHLFQDLVCVTLGALFPADVQVKYKELTPYSILTAANNYIIPPNLYTQQAFTELSHMLIYLLRIKTHFLWLLRSVRLLPYRFNPPGYQFFSKAKGELTLHKP